MPSKSFFGLVELSATTPLPFNREMSPIVNGEGFFFNGAPFKPFSSDG